MAYLLHVSASPAGEALTRATGAALAGALARAGAMEIVERDVGRDPPPFPDAAFAAASVAGETVGSAIACSEALIAELAGAGVLVISTPMHNFSVPAGLKCWIDHVVRPGRTFRGTPEGKVGLLADRPCYLVTGSGGPLPEDGGWQRDFLTPYLVYLLGTIGITMTVTLHLDRLARGEDSRAAARAVAAGWIREQVGVLAGVG